MVSSIGFREQGMAVRLVPYRQGPKDVSKYKILQLVPSYYRVLKFSIKVIRFGKCQKKKYIP